MKTCTQCKKEKNLFRFAGIGNYSSWCRECVAEKSRSYYHANKEKVRAKNKRWQEANREYRNRYRKNRRANNPEAREKIREQQKRYRNKYADELKKKKAAYYIKNQERIKDKMRQRYAEKSGEYKERARQRKNRLKSTVQEPYTKQQIYDRDNGLCFLCEELVDLSLNHPNPMCFSFQHAMPLILGGYDTPDNVLTSHLVCNLRQGTKPFDIGRSHL